MIGRKGERRRRKGTKEILLTGLPIPMVEEIKSLCYQAGPLGRNLTYGEWFGIIYEEWKILKKIAPKQRVVEGVVTEVLPTRFLVRENQGTSDQHEKKKKNRRA